MKRQEILRLLRARRHSRCLTNTPPTCFERERHWICVSLLLKLLKFKNGITNKIRIDNNKVITPPNLFVIERKIVYAKRKYHSGWICNSVIIGFAKIKFSGSRIVMGKKM